MSSPLRRGNRIYFRKAVPLDLRKILGKAEIKVSLGTSDIDAARPEFARLNALWEQRFQSLRRGIVKLSPKDIAALAGEFYKRMVDANEDDPNPDGLRAARASLDGVLAKDPRVQVIPVGPGAPELYRVFMASGEAKRRLEVEAFLLEQGIRLAEEQMDPLVAAVIQMAYAAQQRLVANSQGDYSADAVRDRLPVWVPPAERIAAPGEPVSKKYDILEIFDQMSRERRHAMSTRDRWRPIIEKVAQEHPDIRTLSAEWCVGYKDRLVASGLSAKTIKEANLAALKNLCNYAVANRRINTSPMDGITVKVKARVLMRKTKGYSDDEAKIVLAATSQTFSNLLPSDQHDARRWIPRLGYYMGARGGELAQLRKQDIRKDGDVWIAHVTPEAGTVKSGEPRDVAIHQHLVDLGFIDFVQNCPRDTLFYDAGRKRVPDAKNQPATKTAENLGRWIRSIGLVDEQLQPNHGWRHRFTTVARTVGMDPEIRRYLQGHTPEDEASKYGDYPAAALFREIMKIPRYELD